MSTMYRERGGGGVTIPRCRLSEGNYVIVIWTLFTVSSTLKLTHFFPVVIDAVFNYHGLRSNVAVFGRWW